MNEGEQSTGVERESVHDWWGQYDAPDDLFVCDISRPTTVPPSYFATWLPVIPRLSIVRCTDTCKDLSDIVCFERRFTGIVPTSFLWPIRRPLPGRGIEVGSYVQINRSPAIWLVVDMYSTSDNRRVATLATPSIRGERFIWHPNYTTQLRRFPGLPPLAVRSQLRRIDSSITRREAKDVS